MNPLFSGRRASLAGCLLGVVVTTAGVAQSIPDVVASEATTPEATTPDVAAPSATPSQGAAKAAIPPRPRMGLVVPLTKPKGYVVAKAAPNPSRYQNTKGTEKARQYYAGVWGVDQLKANYTNSGNLIKFSYRVLQPKRAAALGDHENTPELIGIRSNAVLHIPTMEKVGQLRQMSAAEANKDYWMVFSNKGNLVKPGDEVSVIIGKFRADGLIVE
jgi:hypothetical protein